METILVLLAFFLLLVGGFVCLLNFYLSFLRYPLFIFRGGKKEEYKWVSGFPLLGSLMVVIALIWADFPSWVVVIGSVVALLDTGGLHWFLRSLWQQRHDVSEKK